MEHNIKKLLKQRSQAVARRETWRALLDDAYRYAIPNRNPWERQYIGANLSDIVYDNTLVLDHRKFVNRMINALTPPDSNWLQFVPGSNYANIEADEAGSLDEQQAFEVKKQLQQLTETFFFYLRRSNFDLAIHEAFGDMAISTGVLQISEGDKDNPFIFTVVPSDAVAFDGDPRGELKKFYRDWMRVHAYDAQELWPDFKIPDSYKHKDIDELCMDLYEMTLWCHNDKIWKYYVIDRGSEELCHYSESESSEWVAFRWSRLPCENAGRGPVLDALPSAMTLNKVMEFELKAAALAATPPYMAYTNALINPYTFRVEPNTIIPVNQMMSGSWPIAPLPSGANINFSQVVVQDLRNSIHEIMMSTPLLTPPEGPVRTATEIAIQQQNLRENAAASFSRIQRELFDPLVKRCLWILQEKNLIDPIVIDGREVSLAYESPLVVSKNEVEAQKFINFFQLLAAIYTPGLAVNALNNADVVQFLAEKTDIQLGLVKDYAELADMIQTGEQAAADAIESQQPEAVDPLAQLSQFLG